MWGEDVAVRAMTVHKGSKGVSSSNLNFGTIWR